VPTLIKALTVLSYLPARFTTCSPTVWLPVRSRLFLLFLRLKFPIWLRSAISWQAAQILPPLLSPNTNRHGQPKDTLRNIQETGEYVINIVSYEICAGMNLTSADLPPDVSEWETAGFTPASTVKVRPARVAESLLAMECRLHQVVPHGQGSAAANYVIGEVVYFHIADHVLVNGEIDPTRIDYVSRMGGDWYARANLNCMFELPRPKP
jgi:flavin reductase (DIM6/NTAB) family NADH-FMN oxidoreductase RutF